VAEADDHPERGVVRERGQSGAGGEPHHGGHRAQVHRAGMARGLDCLLSLCASSLSVCSRCVPHRCIRPGIVPSTSPRLSAHGVPRGCKRPGIDLSTRFGLFAHSVTHRCIRPGIVTLTSPQLIAQIVPHRCAHGAGPAARQRPLTRPY